MVKTGVMLSWPGSIVIWFFTRKDPKIWLLPRSFSPLNLSSLLLFSKLLIVFLILDQDLRLFLTLVAFFKGLVILSMKICELDFYRKFAFWNPEVLVGYFRKEVLEFDLPRFKNLTFRFLGLINSLIGEMTLTSKFNSLVLWVCVSKSSLRVKGSQMKNMPTLRGYDMVVFGIGRFEIFCGCHLR